MIPDSRGLYKLITFKDAKIGDQLNTMPNLDKFDFEIVELTREKFSAVNSNDCIYVWCKYIGDKN